MYRALSVTSDTKDGSEMPPLSHQLKLSLGALCIMGFLDLVGYMAFMPSLIFYVRALGGTESQYGLILAANSFASFLFTPLYGWWVDASGNQYRKAWFVGGSLMVLGMLLYTSATAFSSNTLALHVLLVSRFLFGCGGASTSIGYTYLTAMAEAEQLTFCTLVLSASNFAGLAFGPFANVILSGLDVNFKIFGLNIEVNEYSGVGLLIAGNTILSIFLIYLFLPEPPPKKSEDAMKSVHYEDPERNKAKWMAVFDEMFTFQLFLPSFALYVVSANYQLIEASFSPAASHGLGWGPIQTSFVMGLNSITLPICAFVVMTLTATYNVPDTTLIVSGFAFWLVAGLMMNSLWTNTAKAWHFVVPISIGLLGFPLIGPATQSNFSKAIVARPELEPIQARLQAVFSMVRDVANFVTPLFVGAFVLRSPTDVENGKNNHELTHFALYIPIFSALCISGFLYEKWILNFDNDAEDEDEAEMNGDVVSESTSLVRTKPTRRRSSITSINTIISGKNQANKMRSTAIMGGNHSISILMPFETASEKKRTKMFHESKKFWTELIEDLEVEEGNFPTDERPCSKKLLMLITTFSKTDRQKEIQKRAIKTLKMVDIGSDELETLDAADPANRERRDALFALSGVRRRYPQFFLVDANGTIEYLDDWEGRDYWEELLEILEGETDEDDSPDEQQPVPF